MSEQHPTNPLHKMTLEKILIALVEQYGWDKLSKSIDINCFYTNPSIKSCLKFLRKTPWARIKVEDMYVRMAKKMNKS
ncbi:MAG: VF530 family protein [Campylobacterota bacterium]|nr:VF530 family protein [Campylobacterota bacterium]